MSTTKRKLFPKAYALLDNQEQLDIKHSEDAKDDEVDYKDFLEGEEDEL